MIKLKLDSCVMPNVVIHVHDCTLISTYCSLSQKKMIEKTNNTFTDTKFTQFGEHQTMVHSVEICKISKNYIYREEHSKV